MRYGGLRPVSNLDAASGAVHADIKQEMEAEMKVIIAGSRTVTSQGLVDQAIKQSGFKIDEVVCGEARGVDTLGRRWAEKRSVPVKSFPADWAKHGKSAGFLRNKAMVDYADALVAVTTGSVGTAHTIRLARECGLPTHVAEVK